MYPRAPAALNSQPTLQPLIVPPEAKREQFTDLNDLQPTALNALSNGWIGCGFSDGRIQLLNPKTWHCVKKFKAAHPIIALTLASNGQLVSVSKMLTTDGRLNSASLSGPIQIWDMLKSNTSPLKTIQQNPAEPIINCKTLENNWIAGCALDSKVIKLFNIETGISKSISVENENQFSSLASLPNNRLASGSMDGVLRIWDLATFDCITSFQSETPGLSALLALPRDELVSGSTSGTIKIWNIATKTPTCRAHLLSHRSWISDFALLAGNRLVSASFDNKTCIWDVAQAKLETTISHENLVRWLGVGAGDEAHDNLIVILRDKKVSLWNIKNPHPLARQVQSLNNSSPQVKAAKDDKAIIKTVSNISSFIVTSQGFLAVGLENGALEFWKMQKSLKIKTIFKHAGTITAISVFPNGNVITCGKGYDIKITSPDEPEQLTQLNANPEASNAGKHTFIETISDDLFIAVHSSDPGAIEFWGTQAARLWFARPISTLSIDPLPPFKKSKDKLHCGNQSNPITALTVLQNSLFIGMADGIIRLYDLQNSYSYISNEMGVSTSTPLQEKMLIGHTGKITAFAILQNGNLMSASVDKTIRVWDLKNETCVAVFSEHTDAVTALAVLDKGILASASKDKTIKLWDSKSSRCLLTLWNDDEIKLLAMLSDGQLVSGTHKNSLRLWNIEHYLLANNAMAEPSSRNSFEFKSENELSPTLVISSVPYPGMPRKANAIYTVFSNNLAIVQKPLPDSYNLKDAYTLTITGHSFPLYNGRLVEHADEQNYYEKKREVIDFNLIDDYLLVTCEWDYSQIEITLNDINSGKFIEMIPVNIQKPIFTFFVEPNWLVFIPGTYHEIIILDLGTRQLNTITLGRASRITTAIGLSENHFVTGAEDGVFRIWDIASKHCIKVWKGHEALISKIIRLSEGKFASSSHDKTINIWDSKTGQLFLSLPNSNMNVTAMALMPNNILISGSENGTVKFWELKTGRCLARLPNTSPVKDLIFFKKGGLCIQFSDGSFKLWDVKNAAAYQKKSMLIANSPHALLSKKPKMERLADLHLDRKDASTYRIFSESVKAAIPLPSGLLAVSINGTIEIWDIENGGVIAYARKGSEIKCINLTEDGKLLCGTSDETVEIWDTHTRQMLQVFDNAQPQSYSAALRPPTQSQVNVNPVNPPPLRDFRDPLPPPRLQGSPYPVSIFGGSSGLHAHEFKIPIEQVIKLSDQRIVTRKLHLYNTLCVITPKTNEIKLFTASQMSRGSYSDSNIQDHVIHDMVALPDGKIAIALGQKGLILVIDPDNSYQNQILLIGHSQEVTKLALISGNKLVSGSLDGTIKIWDLKLRRYIASLEDEQANGGGVTALTYFSDNRLACAYNNKAILIWDLNSRKCIESRTEDQIFNCLVYLPSGYLAGLSASLTMRSIALWKLDSIAKVKKSPQANPRSLLPAKDKPREDKPRDDKPSVRWKINYSEITLLRQIGEGAYGEVYVGKWQRYEVAIKQSRNKNIKPAEIATFETEAEIMTQLNHPYLIHLYGCTLGNPYSLVMEYAHNGSLYNALHDGKLDLPWDMRYKWIEQIAYGIKHLHDNEILHRDMKSLNVLLDAKFNVKLSDFGLSKIESKDDQIQSKDGLKGTIAWMAPELFKNHPATKKSDIYSMGMTFYEIVTNRIPFQDYQNQVDVAKTVLAGTRDIIPAECQPKVAKLITKCWEAKPAARPSIDDVITILNSNEPESANGELPFFDNFSSLPPKRP